MVTHLSYTDTPYYTRFPEIFDALQSLGVHHIRDGYYPWPPSSPIVKAHQQLAASGIKCNYVVPLSLDTTPKAIAKLASETGDMESIEAPNECDVAGNCGATGVIGVANVVAFLPMLQIAANNLDVPLLGPSFTDPSSYPLAGNLASQISLNNLHVYFGGRNPGSTGWGAPDSEGNEYGSFAWWLDQAAIDAPSVPSVITETGYLAYPTTTTPYTIPESVQASYAPRTLLLAYKHGIQKTYTYELLDEVSSPGYGLLNSDLSPRPAFHALENLINTLTDPSSGSFPAGSLQYSVTGGDASLNHLLLEKSDGTFWLVLWLEVPSWDAVKAVPVSVSLENVSLTLPGTYAATTSYQFDSNGDIARTSLNGNPVSLTISDQIAIIEITPQ